MSGLMTSLLKKILKRLAIWTIKKYQPGVILITGSVGKTSTKEAVYTLLRNVRKVRSNSGNFNNELGAPLTILGSWLEIKGILFWPKVIIGSLWRLIFTRPYPELLIMEYAADKPGDIDYLLEIAKPQISIVTAIGEMPVHVEFYSGPDAVAREKSKIIAALPATGFGILNFDDEKVSDMKEETRAHTIAFGFNKDADVRINNLENQSEELPSGAVRPVGLSFSLEHAGNFAHIKLAGVFGRAQAYAIAAAACVGIIFGIPLTRIAEELQYYEAPKRRLKLVSGIKGSFILDDSYNASPLSMRAAIETVHELRAKRKIAILGDMLELGPYTMDAHEQLGRLTRKVFDILITVGPRGKLIASGALQAGFDKDRVFSFDEANQARLEAQKLIQKGDLILVKASRALQLDKIVEEIRHQSAPAI